MEPSAYNPVSTLAIYYPWLAPEGVKDDAAASMWEKVKLVADLQYWWADNQVSNTITFSEEEADDIDTVLEAFEGQLKSASFLPQSTDTYLQMPFTEAPREEVEAYAATLLPVDWSKLAGENDINEQDANKFCDGDSCLI